MSEEARKLAVLLTPYDLESGPGGPFALGEVDLVPGAGAFVRPPLEGVRVTKSLDDVLAFLGQRRFLMVSPASLNEGINHWLRLIGGTEISAERAEFLDAWAEQANLDLPKGFPFVKRDPVGLREHPQYLLGRVFDAMNRVLERDWPSVLMTPRIDVLYTKDANWEKSLQEHKEREARIVESRKRNGDEDLDIIEILKEAATPRLGRATTDAEKKRILGLEEEIKKQVFGQDHAVAAVCEQMLMAGAGLQRLNRPVGGFLFAGPTGVGKTELARQMALSLGVPLLRLDMSEYYDRHSISGLVGSTSGYKDSHRGGLLTNHLLTHPSSVVLFDEIEKGHPDVIQLLLQMLDAARLTDGRGTAVDCSGALILMTTNLGARGVAKKVALGFGNSDTPDAEPEEILESIKAALLPELRNRLDKILVFGRLEPARMPAFVGKALDVLRAQLFMTGTGVNVSDPAAAWLARHGYDADSGARPLERLVDVQIRRPSARLMLAGNALGGTLSVDVGDDGLKVASTAAPFPNLDPYWLKTYGAPYKRAAKIEAMRAMTRSATSPLAIERKRKASLASPVRVFIITPNDIGAINSGLLGRDIELRDEYICVPITQKKGDCFATRPSSEEIVVTGDGEEIRRFVGDKAVMVFSRNAFHDINAQIEACGATSILEGFVEFLDERAQSVGEGHLESPFNLAFEGGCGLDIPTLATDVAPPWLVVDWFLEIYNFILGIEEQKRLFEL